jgi:PAS domain S-box-containing protein
MSDAPARSRSRTPAPSRFAVDPDATPVDVLVVDDRVPELDALQAVLEDPGYHVVRAQSGAEALRLLLKREFAVILLDIHMPEMDGFEVAATIKQRARSRHTPIVFLTATHDDVGAIYRAYKMGAVDYLTKPFDDVVVRAKVGVFAELYRKERRIQFQAEALRVAERRAKQRELRELKALSERRYRMLVESVPAAVITADKAGVFTYCNTHWCELTGLDLQASRRGWLDVVHEEDRDRAAEGWRRAIATGHGYVEEVRIKNVEGVYRWHFARAIAEKGPDGEVKGWLAMISDCDDLKRSVQMRDDFLSIASHELKTPLTTMLLQLEGAMRGSAVLDEKSASRLLGALRQAKRLDKLIENLLDVGRIAGGRLHLNREACDLSEAVRESLSRFEEEAQRTGSPLVFSAEPGVSGSFDGVRIEQVVGNLVSNALKYGRGKPIEVNVEQQNGHALVRVKDHGIGIAPEDKDRIFQRFERAVSPDHYAGMGVGLFVTKQIVEAHGGTIRVESEPGNGAVFTVSLPRSAAGE